MNDLSTLLDRAAGELAADGTGEVAADLARGRRALSRTRRRRGAAAFSGLACVAVVGVGVSRFVDDAPAPPADRSGSDVQLLASELAAGPYTFATTPEGWAVQGVTPSAVTIAPVDGSVSDDPNVFEGKLVIMLDRNPPAGEERTVDGRVFWVHASEGYGRVSTRTLGGEPAGVVQVQYPLDAGWSTDTMLEFLGSVQVGADARAGVG